jgi:hypothetical protein
VFKNTIVTVLQIVFPQCQKLVTAVAYMCGILFLEPNKILLSINGTLFIIYKAGQELTLGEVD